MTYGVRDNRSQLIAQLVRRARRRDCATAERGIGFASPLFSFERHGRRVGARGFEPPLPGAARRSAGSLRSRLRAV